MPRIHTMRAAATGLLLALAASPGFPFEVLNGPSLIMDPNGVTPLAGQIDLTTDVPTRSAWSRA